MDTETPEYQFRKRLEPHYPEGLDEHGREIAVKFLQEIDELNKEPIAILMAFMQVMVEQHVSVIEKLSDGLKGPKLVEKLNGGLILPKRRF